MGFLPFGENCFSIQLDQPVPKSRQARALENRYQSICSAFLWSLPDGP